MKRQRNDEGGFQHLDSALCNNTLFFSGPSPWIRRVPEEAIPVRERPCLQTAHVSQRCMLVCSIDQNSTGPNRARTATPAVQET